MTKSASWCGDLLARCKACAIAQKREKVMNEWYIICADSLFRVDFRRLRQLDVSSRPRARIHWTRYILCRWDLVYLGWIGLRRCIGGVFVVVVVEITCGSVAFDGSDI